MAQLVNKYVCKIIIDFFFLLKTNYILLGVFIKYKVRHVSDVMFCTSIFLLKERNCLIERAFIVYDCNIEYKIDTGR